MAQPTRKELTAQLDLAREIIARQEKLQTEIENELEKQKRINLDTGRQYARRQEALIAAEQALQGLQAALEIYRDASVPMKVDEHGCEQIDIQAASVDQKIIMRACVGLASIMHTVQLGIKGEKQQDIAHMPRF